ncbi:MAG: ABC transporter substrate-binding protein [Solirubrobacterales bacterium]
MAARRMRLAFGLLGVLAIAGAGLSGCEFDTASGSFTPENENVLTVVTQPMPTAGFWEGTAARPTGGFEYALAEEIASQLDLDEVRVETAPFSRIVRGDLGDADIAMSLVTPTPDREKVLEFSTPYIQSPPALIVREGTEIPDVKTAQKQQFAVGLDTTFEDIVNNAIRPHSEPIEFENRNREVKSVARGKTDVAMFDLPAAQALIQQDDRLAIAARLPQTEPIAVALPKGSSNAEAIGSVLRKLETDGTIDLLSEEWLGRSFTDLSNNVPLLRTDQ